MKKKLLILTAIVTLIMAVGVSADNLVHIEHTYLAGESKDFVFDASYITYSLGKYTQLDNVEKGTDDSSFLFTFRVYDGAYAVTSSGSLQGSQTRSNLVPYTTSGYANNIILKTSLSKYCRFGQYIIGDWHIVVSN